MDNIDAQRYDRGMWLLERFSLIPLRRAVLAEARGAVLEVGAGTGANLPFYDSRLHVVAVELRPERLSAAARKAHTAGRADVTVAAADAHDLPFPPASFDTVVGTLVFCSIHDPLAALAEIRRVLRPGGRLLLLEHVRGQTPLTRRLTDGLHPLWFALQGECHLNRETAAAVAAAGFRVERAESHARGLLQLIYAAAPGS
jgi:ubiquinone/menaquinone biosynthesis C-methylase UbiE